MNPVEKIIEGCVVAALIWVIADSGGFVTKHLPHGLAMLAIMYAWGRVSGVRDTVKKLTKRRA